MRSALADLDQAVSAEGTGGVRFTTRHGEPWTTVPKPGKLPGPVNLDRLKDQVGRRWGTIDLLDFLKEADFLTDLTGVFTSVATREVVPRDIVRRRLLYVLFALGRTWASKPWPTGWPARARGPTPRLPYAGRGGPMSTATACAGPSSGWSTPPSPCGHWPVGRRHRLRFGLQEVRCLGVEPHDRVARPLPRPRGNDLLARRETLGVHLLPAQELLVLGGGGHGRGPAAALHRRRCRPQLRRHPWPVRHRVRLYLPARLHPLARLKNIGSQRLYRPDPTATPTTTSAPSSPERSAGT